MYKLAFWLGRVYSSYIRGWTDGREFVSKTEAQRIGAERVESLVKQGCYVQAIKEHRAHFGTTLAAAKAAVDAMQHLHGGGAG